MYNGHDGYIDVYDNDDGLLMITIQADMTISVWT
jgi:hypothetical protein